MAMSAASNQLPQSYPEIMDEKHDVAHRETLDHDVTKEDALHMAELTEAEKLVEKRVRRKIDSLIMPLVVTVYLLNYIGTQIA